MVERGIKAKVLHVHVLCLVRRYSIARPMRRRDVVCLRFFIHKITQ